VIASGGLVQAARGGPSLRATVAVLSIVSALTISVLSFVLFASVLPRATELRQHMEPVSEFYAAVREERPALASRIVFLSGDPEQLTATRSESLPADRVLAKPVDLNVLTARIRRVVGRRS
jgi:hypothetical protein